MPKQACPERAKAFETYKEHQGQIALREIARQLGIPEKSVSGWKCKDKWDFKLTGVLQSKKRSTPNNEKGKKILQSRNREIVYEVSEDAGLTEKQRLFCLYYVKCFNATLAAIKAGYAKDSAHVQGCVLLKHPKVREEISRLKGLVQKEIFVDAMDVLNKYIEIAFADITEYVSFGRREVEVMGAFGPVYEGKGKDKKPVMKTINFVDLKPSDIIDGSLIHEVKQGKDGVSIKFYDKTKALEKLEQYFDLLPDTYKRKVEEEKLKLEREKVALLKQKAGDDDPGEVDDGWLEALEGKAEEVWNDEEL